MAVVQHSIISILEYIILHLTGTCHAHMFKFLDGGGVREYSALLILQKLMVAIGQLERTHPDGPAESSYHPLRQPSKMPEEATPPDIDNVATGCIPDSSSWLPCHYFDYMAGTSTGGYTDLESRHL